MSKTPFVPFVGAILVLLSTSCHGPSGPTPIPDVPTTPAVIHTAQSQTPVTPVPDQPADQEKIAVISPEGVVTIRETRNWTACVFDARILGNQPLLYQYPVSGVGSTPFQEPKECGNYTLQLDVQAGPVCPAFAEYGFDGFRAGRILGEINVTDCSPVCEDEEPVITYGEWSEWQDVIGVSTVEICTEDVKQIRHRARYEQTCENEPEVFLETEYRTIEREVECPSCQLEDTFLRTRFEGKCGERVQIDTWINNCTEEEYDLDPVPAPEDCPKPCEIPDEGYTLSWSGKGDPQTECQAFGDYDAIDDGTPAFFICKAGLDREVQYSYPTGETCSNGKDISHVTACVCSSE